MNTPQAKHGSSAPSTSNAVATEVDIVYIDGKAYPINKNETMLAYAPAHRAEPGAHAPRYAEPGAIQ